MSDSIRANCAFCKIIRGDVEGHSVFEDDISVAFLDQRPLFPGHCLLVPREHYSTLNDLPERLIGVLFGNAQLLARAIEEGLWAEGTFVAINNRVSQSVPHLHIHIVPRRMKDGLKGFFWPRQAYRDANHLLTVRNTLRETIAHLKPAGKGTTLS
jgi:histidine triad (HIT) family protein